VAVAERLRINCTTLGERPSNLLVTRWSDRQSKQAIAQLSTPTPHLIGVAPQDASRHSRERRSAMLFRSETPPSPGNLHVAEPPTSDRPTTAMLKADIDSGATGDKIAAYDPGLSQLGTDDEAAGNAPSHERIALARKTEAASADAKRAARPRSLDAWLVLGFGAFIGGIAAILSTSIWLGS
jgi:hypothetical protein